MTVDTKKIVRVDGLARAITASLNATIGKVGSIQGRREIGAKRDRRARRAILVLPVLKAFKVCEASRGRRATGAKQDRRATGAKRAR